MRLLQYNAFKCRFIMELLTDLPDDIGLITYRCAMMSASFTAMSPFACVDANDFFRGDPALDQSGSYGVAVVHKQL